MLEPLTARQQEILDWISDFIERNGYAPTLREIGHGCGMSSTNAVSDALGILERKGRIKRGLVRQRSIQIVKPKTQTEAA